MSAGPIPKAATLLERMRRKLQTIRARKIYARRKAVVEPVFGQIKHRQGFRQFLLRGADKVRGEWALSYIWHTRSACTSATRSHMQFNRWRLVLSAERQGVETSNLTASFLKFGLADGCGLPK